MKQNKTKNPQDILAKSLEGIYLADAGAGTGKTHTIIRRYRNLIKAGNKPEKILLITFTRNAANQLMEEVIVNLAEDNVDITELLEAPILNFHSLCMKIVKTNGAGAASYLGIDENLTSNFNIIENSTYESEIFRKFFMGFKKKYYKKYKDIFRSLNDDHDTVLTIIKKLSSRGIFPLKTGWLNDGEVLLKGDYEEYSAVFEKLNEEKISEAGNVVNNDLYKLVNSLKDNFYSDVDVKNFLRGKGVDPEIKEDIFLDVTLKNLNEFVRQIYHSYVKYMIERNILNFDFVVMFAFLILYNNKVVREGIQFDYAMVDEFQDTDEIQFLILMLLMKDIDGRANFAVVGDWKQGIYGFRNTTIENILEFEKRLKEYKKVLNADSERITYSVDKVEKIVFEYNYRSSQEILNFSLNTLKCPAKSGDEIDFTLINEKIRSPLTAVRDYGKYSEIEFYRTAESSEDEEVLLILKKISELVNNKKYRILEFDKSGKVPSERAVEFSDICVLSRKKSFGLKIQKAGLENNIPVNYEGGLELFSSKEGILVLAWFRLILNNSSSEGWIPILEKEGYRYGEIKHILNCMDIEKTNSFNIPGKLPEFLNRLCAVKDNILFITELILNRYGFNNEFGRSILNEIGNWTKSGMVSIGELVRLISNSSNDTFDIELNKSSDAVKSQTIHSAKGLEYPVVIVANINRSTFPSTINKINDISFQPHTGLRFRKQYGNCDGYNAIFNNWKTDILLKMFKPENYDEERRLLYVAVTRAKQYLYFTSSNPSEFFLTLMDLAQKKVNDNFDFEIKESGEKKKTVNTIIELPENLKPSKKFISVHGLMNEGIPEDLIGFTNENSVNSKSDALEYGIKIHNIAYKFACGKNINSNTKDVQNLSNFITGLNANELKAEVDFLYPKGDNVIRGTIDLLAFYDDRIEIIDYKTDKNRKYEDRYKIQLGIYKDVIIELYKDINVICKIYYVLLDEIVEI